MALVLRGLIVALAIAMAGCKSTPATTATSPHAQGNPMKIVCLGDSITGQPNLRAYLKWSFILECMCDVSKGEGQVQVLNRGIGGDTTAGALKRLQGDVLDQQPDIVVILLGGNDANGNRPQAEVQANLTSIVQQCQGVGAKVLLLQYHVLPNPDSPDTAWTKLDDNNDVIAAVAAAEGVELLSLATAMEARLATGTVTELKGRDGAGIATWETKPIAQEHLASAKDGVHLNPGGELVFARTVYRKLVDLGWL